MRNTQRKKISKQDFVKERDLLIELMKDFEFPDPQKGILKRISKRLKKYKDELFTFLFHKGISYHNNHAERMLRQSVILRKITFGNRSNNGVMNHNVLMSILQTAKLNNKDPISLLKNILVSRKEPNISMCSGL